MNARLVYYLDEQTAGMVEVLGEHSNVLKMFALLQAQAQNGHLHFTILELWDLQGNLLKEFSNPRKENT